MARIGKSLPLFVLGLIIVIFGTIIIVNQINTKPPAQQEEASETPTTTPVPTITTPTATASATPPPGLRSSGPVATTSPSFDLKSTKAVIRTNKGNIELEFYQKDAPKTVENFVKKAKEGFYNNLKFHRVEDWVVQGGDPKGTGTGGGQMPTEINNKPFVVGSLGVARGGDIKISNDAQFFIVKQNAFWLNSQYTNFGIVTKGMEVVNKIAIGDKILGITVE